MSLLRFPAGPKHLVSCNNTVPSLFSFIWLPHWYCFWVNISAFHNGYANLSPFFSLHLLPEENKAKHTRNASAWDKQKGCGDCGKPVPLGCPGSPNPEGKRPAEKPVSFAGDAEMVPTTRIATQMQVLSLTPVSLFLYLELTFIWPDGWLYYMNEFITLSLNHVVSICFTNTIDFTDTGWNCIAISS